jgi:hypothetical protein
MALYSELSIPPKDMLVRRHRKRGECNNLVNLNQALEGSLRYLVSHKRCRTTKLLSEIPSQGHN